MKFTQVLASSVLSAMAIVATGNAEGIGLKIDQVKQRYPWNGLVDIDYTITDDGSMPLGVDDSIEVTMVDKSVSPAVTNRAITFLQAPLPLTDGKHRVTWNAHADGVTTRTDDADFHVRIVHYAESYMVINIKAGSGTNAIYPVDFLNGTPSGGFNVDEYKGDKIVLRRIHPGLYMAGSPTDEAKRTSSPRGQEAQHRVAITKSFYIGIFEFTQQQYFNVIGYNPAEMQGTSLFRPVENISYATIRGAGLWPSPGSLGEKSFIAKLQGRCRTFNPDTGNYDQPIVGFDLPTSYQWEYACRAGTTLAFNTTNSFDNASYAEHGEQLAQLGRYLGNRSDEKGGITASHTVVGSYLPNAWGLYDMHGNVNELCRDWWVDDVQNLGQYKDPQGPDSGYARVARGGGHGSAVEACRAAYHWGAGETGQNSSLGFRLFFSFQ